MDAISEYNWIWYDLDKIIFIVTTVMLKKYITVFNCEKQLKSVSIKSNKR